jgi:hypothetical protein
MVDDIAGGYDHFKPIPAGATSPEDLKKAGANSFPSRRTSARAMTAGNAAGPIRNRGLDQYQTPPIAIEALLDAEPLPTHVWEPCCGSGSIVAVLRARGHQVTANDVATDGVDFLARSVAPSGAEAIVTNPPFRSAADFVRHGLALVPLVVMLLRLNFLESIPRSDIIDGGRLARVHVFARRVPRMHRADWNGPRASASMTLAWFVWRQDYRGPILLDRVRR